jgi:excinuclease ABC subunit A
VRRHPTSHTGRALAAYDTALGRDGHAVEEGRPLAYVVKLARAQRAPIDETIRIVNAREHNLKSLSVGIPARQVQRDHRRIRLGQVDPRVRHPVQRRPAALSRVAERVCAQHRAAGRAARGRCGLRHSPDRRDRAAAVARRRKSTVATTTEVWHFLRLLYVKLGLQHCTKDGTPVRPQSAESIAAQILRDHKGEHVGLLAPLVVARKGVYTDLAKWAKARGHTHLRVDGDFIKVDPWPRLDRFASTRSSCRSATSSSASPTKASCARC